jgi:hypothetical protein
VITSNLITSMYSRIRIQTKIIEGVDRLVAIAIISEKLSLAPVLAMMNWTDLEPSDGLMDPHC